MAGDGDEDFDSLHFFFKSNDLWPIPRQDSFAQPIDEVGLAVGELC